MIFNYVKLEFQISLEKTVSDVETYSHSGLAEQRCLLAIPVVFRAWLWAHTQTWGVWAGVLPQLLMLWGFIEMFLHCIKYVPGLLQTWSLPCVTLQDTDDRARPWSPAGVMESALRLMALSCVICVEWVVPECTAEHRLSNRNRLTGTQFSSQGYLLQPSLPLPLESIQERQLSSVSCPLQGVGELCSKAGCPGGEQSSKWARDRDRPRVGAEEKQDRAKNRLGE